MDILTQIEIQLGIPLAVGLIGIGLAWTRRRLNLQEGSTAAQLNQAANAAIQHAVANFAGLVAADLANGALTRANAVTRLRGYLLSTVTDSYQRLNPAPETLATMLVGKLAQLAGVPAPGAKP